MGDYFDFYFPPYILEGGAGGESFAPSTRAGARSMSNKNVAGLRADHTGNRVCAATNGDGLQCFSVAP